MKVINNQRQPQPISNGVMLAAAGTEGSVREVTELTDADRKLAGRGLITVVDDSQQSEPPKSPAAPDSATKKEKA